ncbi:IclR family transcriptional regulator [Actinokineospora cianjurensis]|uniref:IclR family transcriptional regulator n=1 Tax=Actinokineospora cianjurensis TaxID=585224 RepID=A0A421B2J1_9PSEU|nr:IclR family transcriptional regulator [Actinokineospora cianjurensis]
MGLLGVDDQSGAGRGVLEGGFRLLDLLSRAGDGMGLSQLARESGLPKATVYRLVEQLVGLGAVQRFRGRYFVGPLLSRLGACWQPIPGLQGAAREPVRVLSALTSAAVVVTVLHGDRVRVVFGTRGVVTELPRIHPADEFPISTATGRVLRLAGAAPDGVTSGEWRRAGVEFRRGGSVVVDRHEVIAGLCCVAAPVLGADGALVAAVGVMVVGERVPQGVDQVVRRASSEITRNLSVG